MKNKISKPRIYTNSTLWLMASGVLTFDWIAKKNVELNNFTDQEFEKYFLNNKIFNSTPTDISFVKGNNMPGSGTAGTPNTYYLYTQGVPAGMESDTYRSDRFWDTVVVLNHNFSRFVGSTGSNNPSIGFTYVTDNNYPQGTITVSGDAIDNSNNINFATSADNYKEIMDGFTLAEITHPATKKSGMAIKMNYQTGHSIGLTSPTSQIIYPFFHIGSFFCAKRFDFDRSADLEMEIEYIYDGIKKQKSINGSTHLNTYYTGRPNWGVQRPFECQGFVDNADTFYANQINSKVTNNGRRRFKIKFSYLEDKHAFNTWTSFRSAEGWTSSTGNPDYALGTIQNANENLNSGDYLEGLEDGSLHGDFLSRTLGGSLPFIMCLDPDEDDNRGFNPDNWAMCMLDGDSIRFSKVADDFYDVELTIDEVF